MIKRFLCDESGATAIEYSLIGTLVSLAIIGVVTILSGNLSEIFVKVEAALP